MSLNESVGVSIKAREAEPPADIYKGIWPCAVIGNWLNDHCCKAVISVSI